MTAPLAEQQKRSKSGFRFRLRSLLILFAIASVILVPLAFLVRGVSTSRRAERTLHAINLVTYVTGTFVEREKRWPSSWDDLCTVHLSKNWSWYSWPADVEDVRALIRVDFDTDVESVSNQTEEEFTAISPTGACYPYRHYGHVSRIIDAARAAVSPQSAASSTATGQKRGRTQKKGRDIRNNHAGCAARRVIRTCLSEWAVAACKPSG